MIVYLGGIGVWVFFYFGWGLVIGILVLRMVELALEFVISVRGVVDFLEIGIAVLEIAVF